MSNLPLSDQWRLAAEKAVRADKVATLLQQTKSAVLAQRMNRLGDKPVAHAERDVKGSPEWFEYITKMVEAREHAELLKIEAAWLKMKHHEHESANADRRAEMRMG